MNIPTYDEASSSDDESDNGSSENSFDDDEEIEQEIEQSSNSSQASRDSSDSEEDDDIDEELEMNDKDTGKKRKFETLKGNDSDDDDDDDSSTDNNRNLDAPLHERLKSGQQKSQLLQKKREKRKSALEIASERLAQLKKARRESGDSKEPLSTTSSNQKKRSKHAPAEVSSKRIDFFRRGPHRLNESGLGVEIGAKRYRPMDPRTSSLSGHLNEEQFETNYEFLQEMRDKEIALLKKQIAARKQTGKKGKRQRHKLNVSADGSLEEDEERLKKLKQEKADFERRRVERAAKKAVKKKIQNDVAEGKSGVYFLKRKEKKKLEFEAKMEELRKRGGHKAVEKALARRRQKAKSRDAGIFAK